MKHSEYDHMDYFISFRRPTHSWSNLTLFVMAYDNHGHPIKTNTYKSAKNLNIDLKLLKYHHMGHPIKTHFHKWAKN